jgi:CotS family spore coat protein
LGEHFELENRIKEYLMEKGLPMTDRVVKNKEGDTVTEWETGEKYVVYEWYAGNECDYRSMSNLCQAAANLGRLHVALRDFSDEPVLPAENLLERYRRHTRELKRVYAFMKEKKRKSGFEMDALSCYPQFAKKACAAKERLAQSSYFQKNGAGTKDLCHGEYNYHNLIMTEKGVATTNFEKMHYGLQLMDFAYFFRKVMEKNYWDSEKGKAMIRSYREQAGFSEDECEFFRIVLSYPEKYWKLMNHYINGKKTWISDKNMEKLKSVKEQEQAKEKFLQTIADF